MKPFSLTLFTTRGDAQMNRIVATCTTAAMLASLGTARSILASPIIINPGTVYTPGRSFGRAISDTGVLVGESTWTANGADVAYRWTSSGGFLPLGTFGGAASAAY